MTPHNKATTNPYTKLGLRIWLLESSLTLADIARKHGFEIATVQAIVGRYWDSDREPRGDITRQIIQAVKDEIEASRGEESDQKAAC